ncbi:hypothetical protein [Arthrobacter agilis]|uniref:hypothetical protein n=1 Tax=Arthrobacter agilis TaxID=37921 RepID=UPI0027880CB2|nr:hypothetical protein [Arthrobacter agilis]MDQ0735294.1 hypothetical protein [Arthrobacter agilis]
MIRTESVDLHQANTGHLILAMSHSGETKAFEKIGDDEWQKMGAGINYSDAGVRAWAHDWCDLVQRGPLNVPSDIAVERLRQKLGGSS